MSNMGLRVYFQPNPGQSIESFAEELSDVRKTLAYDIIAEYNGTCLVVTKEMTREEIKEQYFEKEKK